MQSTQAGRLIGSSRNILLRQLAERDRLLLEPHIREILVACGATVIRAEQPLDAIYFPDTALLSLEEERESGRRLEIGIVGTEGLLGWPILLGEGHSAHTAIVRMSAGRLLRLEASAARTVCAESATLLASLLRYVGTMLVQMANSIASNLDHAPERRLARFLLMRHDRVGGDLLSLQHHEIAESLNVRRASVTDRLHILEGERLIRCTRGRVMIRDRRALEAFAGEAYGAAEARYRALIAPFGKTAKAA